MRETSTAPQFNGALHHRQSVRPIANAPPRRVSQSSPLDGMTDGQTMSQRTFQNACRRPIYYSTRVHAHNYRIAFVLESNEQIWSTKDSTTNDVLPVPHVHNIRYLALIVHRRTCFQATRDNLGNLPSLSLRNTRFANKSDRVLFGSSTARKPFI